MKASNWLTVAVAVVVSAAATAAESPAPVCSGQVACERMWLKAQETAETLSGMKLRMVTESRIETFPPSSQDRTGITVLKYPLGGGRYEIRAKFECHPSRDCSKIAPLGLDAFNSTLN